MFYITTNDADLRTLNFIRTSFDKYLDHMLVKFEQNHMAQNIFKNRASWQKW